MQQPGRQRLKLWLEEQIESGKYPGVDWLDKPARIFQIPWKHAARHGWSIDRDATLFRSWAMHTGRYRPGKDKPDPKTWKANFRCALNSLPDICELQEHSKKRGSNASRVYKMLPGVQTHRRRRGPRSPSRPREKTPSLGPYPSADTCTMLTWQPVTHFSEVQRMAESHVEGTHVTQMHGTWGGKPDEQEQNEAVFKLMDHVGSLDVWNQAEGQRAWRAHTLWDHCHCSADDNPYCLHTDNYSELFAPSYIKEFSDWSTY